MLRPGFRLIDLFHALRLLFPHFLEIRRFAILGKQFGVFLQVVHIEDFDFTEGLDDMTLVTLPPSTCMTILTSDFLAMFIFSRQNLRGRNRVLTK